MRIHPPHPPDRAQLSRMAALVKGEPTIGNPLCDTIVAKVAAAFRYFITSMPADTQSQVAVIC